MEDILNKVSYSPESPSRLIWNQDIGKKVKSGDTCGSLDKNRGYWLTAYNGKRYKVHRLIWEIFNGPIPDGMVIDHRDGKENNIDNLRLATKEQNARNSIKKSNRSDLPKGIRFKGKPGYMTAEIKASGKRYHKHSYDLQYLITWLDKMRDTLHGDFSRY